MEVKRGIVWSSVVVWAISAALAYKLGVGYYGIGFAFALYLIFDRIIPARKRQAVGGVIDEKTV